MRLPAGTRRESTGDGNGGILRVLRRRGPSLGFPRRETVPGEVSTGERRCFISVRRVRPAIAWAVGGGEGEVVARNRGDGRPKRKVAETIHSRGGVTA
jgi:hypothetical protein